MPLTASSVRAVRLPGAAIDLEIVCMTLGARGVQYLCRTVVDLSAIVVNEAPK